MSNARHVADFTRSIANESPAQIKERLILLVTFMFDRESQVLELEAQLRAAHTQIQGLTSENAAMRLRIDELSMRLQAIDSEKLSHQMQANALRQAQEQSHRDAVSYRDKSLHLDRAVAELNQRLELVTHTATINEERNRSLHTELQNTIAQYQGQLIAGEEKMNAMRLSHNYGVGQYEALQAENRNLAAQVESLLEHKKKFDSWYAEHGQRLVDAEHHRRTRSQQRILQIQERKKEEPKRLRDRETSRQSVEELDKEEDEAEEWPNVTPVVE